MRFNTPVKFLVSVIFLFSLSQRVLAQPAGLTDKELADYWYANGNYEEALKVAENAWTSFQTYGAGIDFAVMLWKTGNRQKSVDTFNEVIERYPKYWDADIVLADLYKKENRFKSAERVLRKLYRRMPYDIMAVKSYAGILLALQRADESVALLNNYKPKAKDRFDYYAIYAAAHYETKQYQIALDTYKILIKMRPDLLDFQWSLGNCYRRLKMWDEARALYTEMQTKYPKNGEGWKQMGLLEYELGELEPALEQLKIAKEKFEKRRNRKGIKDANYLIDEVEWIQIKSFMNKGDFEYACPRLDELRNRNSMVRYGFDAAICYRESKQYEQATVIFTDLVQKNADHTALFVEFNESLRRQNDLTQARTHLESYIQKNGYTSAKVVSVLATLYLEQEDYQSALNTIAKARKYMKSDKDSLYYSFIAANAFQGLGQEDKANQFFSKAEKVAPDLLTSHMDIFDLRKSPTKNAASHLMISAMYNEYGLTPAVRMKRAALQLGARNWEKVLEDCEFLLNDETLPPDTMELGTAKALKLEAKFGMAGSSFAEGDPSQGVAIYRQVYEANPTSVQAIAKYAGGLLGVQKANEAVALLESFTPTEADLFSYYGIYSASQYEAKNYAKALDIYKILIEMRPDLLDFQYSLGNCYRKLKKWDEARELYATLQTDFPDKGNPYKQMGLLEYELQNFEPSIEQLTLAKNKFELIDDQKAVIDAQNLIDEVQWIYAKNIMNSGDFETACNTFDELRAKSDMIRYGFDAAICYRESKQHEQSTVIFTDLVQKHPDYMPLFIEFIVNIQRQKNRPAAKKHLEEHVKTHGYTSEKIVSLLAIFYLENKEYSDALNALNEVQPYLSGESTPLFYDFISATAHQGLGQNELAEDYIKKAEARASDLLIGHKEVFDLQLGVKNNGEAQLILTTLYTENGLTADLRMKRASLQLSAENWAKVLDDCYAVLDDDTLPEGAIPIGTAHALVQEAKIGIAGRHFKAGETYEAVEVYKDVFLTNSDSRNAINYGYFVSTISESHRTDEIMSNALTKDPTNNSIYQVWSEVLLTEHRAPEIIDLMPLEVGGNHVYERGLSELMIKALMEMAKWEDIGSTLTSIREQPIQLGLNEPLTVGELPDALIPIEAIYHNKEGNFEAALQSWAILAEKYPEVSAYPMEIALLHNSAKDYDTTRKLFNELLETFPEDANVWKQYSGFLRAQKDEVGAEEAIQKSLSLLLSQEPENFWPHLEWEMALGSTYFGMGEFEKAEQIFRGITTRVPYYFASYNVLGFLYLEQKDFYNAAIAFKMAQEKQPKNPYVHLAISQTYMRHMNPGQSRASEVKSMPLMYRFDEMVQTLKSSSLGVFGYRPLPWLGTVVDYTQLSVRPNAMMLVRESAFSDDPLAGFQIDQKVFKQNVGFFAPNLPAVWVNYTNVNSSGSLDVVANLMEIKVHQANNLKSGTLQVYPTFKYLLESPKGSEVPPTPFPMGNLRVEFVPTRSSVTVAADGSYGLQRLDKVGPATEFFAGTVSAARAVGSQSVFMGVSVRKDKLPDGMVFDSAITETAIKTNIGKVIPSMLVKTEYVSGLPKIDTAFGYQVMGSLEYRAFKDHYVPYSNFSIVRSQQYEFGHTNSAEIGLAYQNGVMMKTREMNRWYKYKIPYLIKASYQQNWYPNSSIPTSGTLFLNMRII